MKARVSRDNIVYAHTDTSAAVKSLLNGEAAEIYAALDPDTGKVSVTHKCGTHAAACLLLAQTVESLAKTGLSHSLIKEAVTIGLDYKNRI